MKNMSAELTARNPFSNGMSGMWSEHAGLVGLSWNLAAWDEGRGEAASVTKLEDFLKTLEGYFSYFWCCIFHDFGSMVKPASPLIDRCPRCLC